MTAIAHFDDHQVVAFARWLEADLAEIVDRPMWSMSTRDAEHALLALTRVRGQLDALLMRVLRQAEAVGAGLDTGATSTTNWWSHATRTTRAEAHRTARLARSLEDHEEVGRALVAGDVRTEQARVVTEAVDALPDVVEEGVPEAATRFLLEKAGEHDARRSGSWAAACWRWSTRMPPMPTRRVGWRRRRRMPWLLRRSPWSTTGEGRATAASPSPHCMGRCSPRT